MSDDWTPPSVLDEDRSEAAHALELVTKLTEDWFDDAACKGLGDLFYPTRDDDVSARMAKAVCAECRVRPLCAEWCLTLPYHYPGVFGGMSQKERQKAKTARGRVA